MKNSGEANFVSPKNLAIMHFNNINKYVANSYKCRKKKIS